MKPLIYAIFNVIKEQERTVIVNRFQNRPTSFPAFFCIYNYYDRHIRVSLNKCVGKIFIQTCLIIIVYVLTLIDATVRWFPFIVKHTMFAVYFLQVFLLTCFVF